MDDRIDPMEWTPMVCIVGFLLLCVAMVALSSWSEVEKTRASVRMMELKSEGK